MQKKTAVLIYDSFCNFEISVALEILALSGKEIIGAISIAPILLVKAGLLKGKSFLAGVNKEEILEEGYIISGNMITSVSYNFVRWALGFGKLLGIDIPSENFGVK